MASDVCSEILLTIERSGFVTLYESCHGNLAVAAYRYAWLKNASLGYAAATPTRRELYACARRLCEELGLTLWPRDALAAEARLIGLDVLD